MFDIAMEYENSIMDLRIMMEESWIATLDFMAKNIKYVGLSPLKSIKKIMIKRIMNPK